MTTDAWPRSPITGRVVLGARVGRRTFAATVARTDAVLARLREEREGLAAALTLAADAICAGECTVDVVGDLRARLDHLAALAPAPYRPSADRLPVVEPDPTGMRGLSDSMRIQLARMTDEWYAASAWWREDADAREAR